MKRILKHLIFFTALSSSLVCQSQRLIDKLGFYVAPGIAIIPGKENLNQVYIPKNAFGGFRPGLSLNFCILYYKNDRLSYGLDGQFFITGKANHSLYHTSAGPVIKYNITSSFNTVSPFILGGPRFGYTYLNRSQYQISTRPGPSGDPKLVDVTNLDLEFGYTRFAIPSFGATAGAGVDIKINKRLKVFVMGSYTFHMAKNNGDLKENYAENKSNLMFITGEAGINYKLVKSTNKKNINNLAAHQAEQRRQQTMKKIAQASAKKNVTQKMPSIHTSEYNGKPGSGMKFKTLSKEGLDPNKKYTVNGQVQGGEGRKLDDVSVLILDEKGNVVGSAKPDKNGRFAYTGLKPDNYNIALNKNDPRLKADASLSADDPEMKVSANALNKFAYNRLASQGKPAGIVMGDAKLNSTGQPAQDQTMLLVDEKGNVVSSTKTNKDGKYAFRNLRSDNYQVVAADNPDVKANAVAASGDPSLQIDENQFKQFGFKKLANGQQLQGVVTGKITAGGDQKSASDQTVLILDENGNVVGKTQTNKEGRFAFKGLSPDNYQAVIDGNPAGLTAKAGLSATDPSLQISENAFAKTGATGDKFVTGKVDFAPGTQISGKANVLLIDDKGNVVETAKVDKDGNFVIKNVRSSGYQVVVEGADYKNMTLDVAKNDKANSSLASDAFAKAGAMKMNADGSPQNVVVGKIDMGGNALPEAGANVILIDEKGNAVERTTSDKDGNFVFKNVRSANYQAIVEGQDYKKVDMDVAGSNNTAKVTAQDLIRHGFNKVASSSTPAQQDNMVVGKITSDVPGKPVTDKTVLLLDNKGAVVGKTVVSKDGTFTFNGLKAENYQTVLEKPDAGVKTNLSPMVKDPDMKISMKDVMKYNPITKSMEKLTDQDHVVITGTMKTDDYIAAENRTVMLLDEKGNVVKEVTSDKSGVFKFHGIKASDYQVVYQDGDKKVNPTIQMYKDNDPAVTEQGGKIAKSLFYGSNEFKLNEADKAELNKFVKFYKEHPNMKMIKLNAYGDASGSDQANMEITQKRADQVLEYLEKQGVPKDKLKLNPMGKSLKFKNKYNQPDPKLNRKVDIEIVE